LRGQELIRHCPLAHAVADGARETGAQVDIRRVPETVPEEIARKSGFKLDQKAPIAKVDELPQYDAIIFGSPTRFGHAARWPGVDDSHVPYRAAAPGHGVFAPIVFTGLDSGGRFRWVLTSPIFCAKRND
jgi:hypothetical protein